MINIIHPQKTRRDKAQGMVEFALVFPVVLLLIYGIMEFGRMIYIYSSVTTASREAARYGVAVGTVGGVPRYLDCPGILDAAERAAILVPMDNMTIS
jgi:TadE-like protein